MLYVNATAVGVVTGLLAPVIVLAIMSVVFVGSVSIMVDAAVILVAVGFSIGFGWTLWRARTKAQKAN